MVAGVIAVVESGSHQYMVREGQVIKVEKLDVEPGGEVNLRVIAYFGPGVSEFSGAGAVAQGKVLEQIKGEKIIIFKKRRRKNSRRKNGHRQLFTVIRVERLGIS